MLKVFVVVGGVLLVGGTATLIWLLVQRSTSRGEAPVATAPALPGTVEVPVGARIEAANLVGRQLVLLGEVAGQGQFVLVVDAASGARRHLLRLVPEPR